MALALQILLEGDALNQLHNDIIRAVLAADVEHGNNICLLYTSHDVEDCVNGKECLRHGNALVRGVVERALEPLGSRGERRVQAVADLSLIHI